MRLVRQVGLGDTRYDTVCGGCPAWAECVDCAVDNGTLEPTCSLPLAHTSASDSGSTLETLSVDKGYWRASKNSATILECYNTAACQGGETGTESFCENGYTGSCESSQRRVNAMMMFSNVSRPSFIVPGGARQEEKIKTTPHSLLKRTE